MTNPDYEALKIIKNKEIKNYSDCLMLTNKLNYLMNNLFDAFIMS